MTLENKIYENVLKALDTIGEDIDFFSAKFKEHYGDEIVDWDKISIQTALNICDLLALGSLESFQYEYNKRAHEVLLWHKFERGESLLKKNKKIEAILDRIERVIGT